MNTQPHTVTATGFGSVIIENFASHVEAIRYAKAWKRHGYVLRVNGLRL